MKLLLPLVFAAGFTLPQVARGEKTQISFQYKALAANAGGQDAYALRYANDKREWTAFTNQYLNAGGMPVLGGIYSFRLPACPLSCWNPIYFQYGAGLSTAGPLAELLVGITVLKVIRIDMATHLIATQNRLIVWSYPIWFGFSLIF